jgi:hypothetical protein
MSMSLSRGKFARRIVTNAGSLFVASIIWMPAGDTLAGSPACPTSGPDDLQFVKCDVAKSCEAKAGGEAAGNYVLDSCCVPSDLIPPIPMNCPPGTGGYSITYLNKGWACFTERDGDGIGTVTGDMTVNVVTEVSMGKECLETVTGSKAFLPRRLASACENGAVLVGARLFGGQKPACSWANDQCTCTLVYHDATRVISGDYSQPDFNKLDFDPADPSPYNQAYFSRSGDKLVIETWGEDDLSQPKGNWGLAPR